MPIRKPLKTKLQFQIENKEKASGWNQRTKQVHRDFKEWCIRQGIPFGLNYDNVAGFLCSFVEKMKGSTKSIRNMLSALRTYERKCGRHWISDQDQYKLERFVRQLEYLDLVPVKRSRPATLEVITQVKSVLRRNRPADQLFYLTMLLLHNGMLRSSELMSVKLKDVEWNHKDGYFIMSVNRTKTHRSGGPQEVYYSDYKGDSAFKALRKWLTSYGHLYCTDSYLIPRTEVSGKINVNSKQVSGEWTKILQGHFQRAGFAPSYFTGHSFRAGGATDLFAASIPIHDIQKLGRWTSMAVMVYNRQAPRDVARKASRAFQGTCHAINRIRNKEWKMWFRGSMGRTG